MSQWRSVWRRGWRLVICGVLLVWIAHAIFTEEGQHAWPVSGREWSSLSRWQQWEFAWSRGPAELWRTMTLTRPTAFAASLGFMGLTIFLGVWRWRMVLRVQGLELPGKRATEISLVAHFFNSFLLGSTGGDLLKAYYAARETHHKKPEAVVTVAVDRLIGLFSLLLFACLMMVANLPLLLSHRRLAAIGGLVVAMLVGCGGVVALAFWGGMSRRWPEARTWLRRLPRGDLLEDCLNACRAFGQERGFLLRTMGVSMAINVACVLQLLSLARGMDLAVTPLALFAIVPIVVCLSALPITPSGLGVRENLYVWMLAVPEIGVPSTQAFSLSLLAYAGSLLWSVGGGVVYLLARDRHQLAGVTATE